MLNTEKWVDKYLSPGGRREGSPDETSSSDEDIQVRRRAPFERSLHEGSSLLDQDGPQPDNFTIDAEPPQSQSSMDSMPDIDWTSFKGKDKPFSYTKLFMTNKSEFAKEILKRCPYYAFPILLWLPKVDWRNDFIWDVVAAIGVSCMLIPQALSYALLAGVPPAMGLYTAWSPLIVFACLTTSRHVHVGPDALGSLLVGLTLFKRPEIDPSILAPIYAMLCGISMLILGVFRFGFLDNVLSRPLLSGFVNAVAVIIFIEQLNGFFGIPKPEEHLEYSWQKLAYFFQHLSETEWTTLLTGTLCLLILVTQRALQHYFPQVKFLRYMIATLFVVILGIVLSIAIDFEHNGVKILGHFNCSFPVPSTPTISVDVLTDNFADCIVIVIIGFIETIVAIKIYATKHSYQISPNRELVALGMMNIVGSFFQIYPTFASLTRSAMADFLGAKTQLYTLMTSFVVLIMIFVGNRLFYYLPLVVMNSIIILAAYSLVELHDLVFLVKVRAWQELFLFVVTFLVTIFLGVDLGIFIGAGISLLLVVKHTTLPHIAILGKDDNDWVDVHQDSSAKVIPGILVLKIEESLYFANIEQIKDMLKRIQEFGSHLAHPTDQKDKQPLHAIVIHAKNIAEMDASAIQIVLEMVEDYQRQNIFVCFVKLRASLRNKFLVSGIIDSLGGDRLFSSCDDAIQYIQQLLRADSIQTLSSPNFANLANLPVLDGNELKDLNPEPAQAPINSGMDSEPTEDLVHLEPE